MKRALTILITLQLFMLIRLVAQPAANSIQILQTRQKDHPRLLLLKGEEKALMAQIGKYPQWQTVHKAMLEECDRLLDAAPVERIKIGKRLLDKSRECLRRVFMLSYAYRTTGEQKYLSRAEKELLAVAAFEDWNPTHFLDVAEMTMAVAIGYDWLFEKLSESTRARLREAILAKGINPSLDKTYNWFLSAEHNWNQVCNAGITFGALAIAEHEPAIAAQIVKRAVGSVPKAMLHSYKPDGAYPEGFSYWGYGTSFNVLLISALEKALGTDFGLSASDGFLKTGSFMQHLVGPTGLAHNWGDSGLKEGLTPALFWFAQKTQDPSLLWGQKTLLSAPGQTEVKNRILPALLIWGTQTELSAVHAPTRTFWAGQGPSPVALMRSSWENPNAVFLGVKAGSPAVNHAHMDVGSFVMDALGERWAMDFGMQDYNSLESKGVDLWNRSQNSQRWEVFRLNNFAHNVLSFDGRLTNAKGYARIDGATEAGPNKMVITDLSEMYQDQAKGVRRGLGIIDQRYAVVRDEIECGQKETVMRWNMLTSADVRIVDGKTVELSQNGKKMLLIFDTQTPISIRTWPTTPPHDYDAPNPGTTFVGFEAKLAAGSRHSFSAYLSGSRDVAPTKALAEWPVKPLN
ncbi:heparinase II/III domain-containing protein [Dyadobacter fermentans]|uniref:heparinase II/III domain-containing protein n=1 Tax=Dyadobacter fermentans TaxID=94254 RepID=UPI001CC042EF|nr:heparinase II/III family protein [Dyadobacter fermentans]MBZ1357858.1 heparinase II/III family protein [Dyadobacter fermentans]